ncbi:MAG: dTDP-4-dehydrorhamnose 3,5-epimerase family protein, partial [Thiogranum sp.]
PGDEYGIAWDDPALDISWPDGPFRLSDKDKNNPTLSAAADVLPEFRADA